jgi:hypothetical protein
MDVYRLFFILIYTNNVKKNRAVSYYRCVNRLISTTCTEGWRAAWEESPESQAGVHYRFPTRVGNPGKSGHRRRRIEGDDGYRRMNVMLPCCRHSECIPPSPTVRSDQKMKVLQGVAATLLIGGGALFTWATAMALEEYAIDQHAASAASADGGTVVPYRPPEARPSF